MPTVAQLVLASQSPFRKALLASTGLAFAVEVAPVDEATVQNADPRALALGRARLKGAAVARQRLRQGGGGALVIGADQVLSFEGGTFDKAKTEAEATARLRQLAGKTHYLHSAVTLSLAAEAAVLERAAFVVDVPMTMRALSDAEIAAYVRFGEWRGAVGCYQFENRGIQLFDGVDSDWSSIVGLPLQPLLKALRALGVEGLAAPEPPWHVR